MYLYILFFEYNLYMKDQLIGVHIKSDTRFINNILSVIPSNINIIQLFIDINIQKEIYIKLSKILEKRNIKCIVHSAYTINLSKDWDKYSWWIKYILYEIKIAHILKAKAIVFHVGKKMGLDLNSAINNMYTLLMYIDEESLKYKNIKFLIETPAGQGTEIFTDFTKLLQFIKKINNKINNKRFGLCFDTCHVFSVGYDIRNKLIVNKLLQDIEYIIGLDKLYLVHLNDSKKDLGERKDRHENIGDGFIGNTALSYLVKKIKKLKIPIILETPSGKHKKEVNFITKC